MVTIVGVPARVKCADAIPVGGTGQQPNVTISADVRRNRRDLRPGTRNAAAVRSPLNQETVLVVGGVTPGEIDLADKYGIDLQVRRSIRNGLRVGNRKATDEPEKKPVKQPALATFLDP